MPRKTPDSAASPPPISQVQRTTFAHVDADDLGQRGVLGHRAHRSAERGARQEEVQDDARRARPGPTTQSWSAVRRTPPRIWRGTSGRAIWIARLK